LPTEEIETPSEQLNAKKLLEETIWSCLVNRK